MRVLALNVLLVAVSYFIGNISPAILITKRLTKTDIRRQGSGNAGTTNVLRTLGPVAAAVTLLIDISKGVAAVLIGRYLSSGGHIDGVWIANQDMAMACGLAVFIGHIWPVVFGFRGGKGVATGLGVIMTVIPAIGWISLVTGLAIILISKRVSLGAVIGVAVLPVSVYFYDAMYVSWAVIIAVIVLIKHRQNIIRLCKGQEPALKSKWRNMS